MLGFAKIPLCGLEIYFYLAGNQSLECQVFAADSLDDSDWSHLGIK